MPRISCQPVLSNSDGFLQTIQLLENRTQIGQARWHSPQGATDGVAQILNFQIAPPFQRQGYGRQLLAALIDQCTAYHKLRKIPLRRIWLGLNHRKHIIARAFFMSQDFTHTATVKELLLPQNDLLICVRTFD